MTRTSGRRHAKLGRQTETRPACTRQDRLPQAAQLEPPAEQGGPRPWPSSCRPGCPHRAPVTSHAGAALFTSPRPWTLLYPRRPHLLPPVLCVILGEPWQAAQAGVDVQAAMQGRHVHAVQQVACRGREGRRAGTIQSSHTSTLPEALPLDWQRYLGYPASGGHRAGTTGRCSARRRHRHTPVMASVSALVSPRACAGRGVCKAPPAAAVALLAEAALRGESAGEPAAVAAAAAAARVGELAACRVARKEAVRAAPRVSAPGAPAPLRGDAAGAAGAAGVPTACGTSSGVGGAASATPGACRDWATRRPAARRSAAPSSRGSSSLRCRASCSSCCRSAAAQRTARRPMVRACARTLVSQL